MKNITSLLAATLTLTAASLIAEPTTEAPATEAPATEKAEAKKADVEITVSCNDTMKFDTAVIEAKAGQTVQITIKNTGKLPKAAMGHNIVILNKGIEVMAWAGKAITAAATDYVPENAGADVIAHSKILGPGESEVVTFTVKEAGEYPFLCSFPGHAGLMKGKVVVK